MNWANIFLIAVGLSMDAFAMAITVGLSIPKAGIKEALIVGLYFGLFQAAMPVVGYYAARQFADLITQYDHWVVFGLLVFIGGKMIWGSINKEERPNAQPYSLGFANMLTLALATSIDAMAVGISFAFLQTSIVPAGIVIGITTFAFSLVGVKIGCIFGTKCKTQATLAGGVILVLMGIRMLL